jgi:hypothetical protein
MEHPSLRRALAMLQAAFGVFVGGLVLVIIPVVLSGIVPRIPFDQLTAKGRAERAAEQAAERARVEARRAEAARMTDSMRSWESAPSTQVRSTSIALVPARRDFVLEFGSAVVGGYVAAFIAGRAELLSGTLAAWPHAVLLAIGMLGVGTSGRTSPRDILWVVGATLLGTAGGFLRRLRRRRSDDA